MTADEAHIQDDLTRAKRLRKAGRWIAALGAAGTMGALVYASVVSRVSNDSVPFAITYVPLTTISAATVARASGLFGRARRFEKKTAAQNSLRVSVTPGGIYVAGPS